LRGLRRGGFLIARIHQIGGRIFSRLLKQHGIEEINPAQGRILFVLWSRDRIPISELARRTSLGKSTLTSMLDRLERSGLIRREDSGRDRREILIARTEKDRLLEQRYTEVSRAMTDLFYRGFSRSEIARFEGYLERILDNLTAVL
jgi:DNA-binding MarR family transcriptional regulator